MNNKQNSINNFFILIEELNRCLKERRACTNWIRVNKLLINFCNLLARMGVIYAYEKKKDGNNIFLRLSLTLFNGLPVMLSFHNYFYPGKTERRFFAFQNRAAGLNADYIYLTPYGFLSRGELGKYKNVPKIFIGYFSIR